MSWSLITVGDKMLTLKVNRIGPELITHIKYNNYNSFKEHKEF